MLGVQPDSGAGRNLGEKDRPWPGQIHWNGLRAGDACLLGEFPQRASQDRLAGQPRTGRRSPGPVTVIVRSSVRPVQQEILVARMAAGPPHDDRRAMRIVGGDRQAIPGQLRTGWRPPSLLHLASRVVPTGLVRATEG